MENTEVGSYLQIQLMILILIRVETELVTVSSFTTVNGEVRNETGAGFVIRAFNYVNTAGLDQIGAYLALETELMTSRSLMASSFLKQSQDSLGASRECFHSLRRGRKPLRRLLYQVFSCWGAGSQA